VTKALSYSNTFQVGGTAPLILHLSYSEGILMDIGKALMIYYSTQSGPTLLLSLPEEFRHGVYFWQLIEGCDTILEGEDDEYGKCRSR
jgi:hypothetical protein